MTKIICIFHLLLQCTIGLGQSQQTVDKMQQALAIAKHDTSRVQLMTGLSLVYRFSNPDSALYYCNQAEILADKIKYLDGKVRTIGIKATVYYGLGNLPKAIELGLQALQIADNHQLVGAKTSALHAIGLVYRELKDYEKALGYLHQAKKAEEDVNNMYGMYLTEIIIGSVFEEWNQLDSASFYLNQADKHYESYKTPNNITLNKNPYLYIGLGKIQAKLGQPKRALTEYQKSIQMSLLDSDHRYLSWAFTDMARLYKNLNNRDSSIYYAKKGLAEAEIGQQKKRTLEAATFLYEQYETNDPKVALGYYKIASNVKDSLFGSGNIQAIQEMVKQVENRQKEAETTKIAYQNQLKQYALLTGLGIMLLVGFMLYRNNQKEKKAKNLLQEKNEVIEKALTNLKSTQNQLIQKEKLASLGELTAGIAHEIQNPLNFVNNFSELSVDLVKDLKDEMDKPDIDKTYIEELFDDLSSNQEKINHHGKRASSIVKGMLEHSRASTGERALTDINALADEYLRLSYHGLRAKDKNFNSDYKIEIDENLPKINVVPQDIGRVLLNLYNNAFYAVNEKKKQHTEGGYQPIVLVSTVYKDNFIDIKVTDNGNGIPENIKEKIFQPFFTTKPTGQGTGLGLSLAYDIVTKGHNGKLEIETKEGEFTEFIIQLPYL